jgi:DNA repair protein RadD
MKPRPYQTAAFQAAINWMKACIEPAVIEAATGAGKSLIVAMIAEWITRQSGKKVLCLAPSKELTEQNYERYLSYGNPASFYSSSLGKSMAHDVVFGTPLTVKNALDKFGDQFACIIIDECHGITSTVKNIVETIKGKNKNVRVIGLSATPYRLGSGYIYQYDESGDPVPESETHNPYFNRLLCRITAQELIALGYLTKPVACEHEAQSYDTSGLTVNSMGKFEGVDEAFEGMGRKTSAIVSEIVELSKNRQGVVIFAATLRHAKEVFDSLPPAISALVDGKTGKKEREQIVKRFKQRQIKYLVNVGVFTTGFDAPHVDVVALLRATESVGLMQQMIGRGLRLFDGKDNCLVLDYAENIERHCPNGDLFDPTIKAIKPSDGEIVVEAKCPMCATTNQFAGRPNPDDFAVDDYGYFVDLMGSQIKNDDEKPIPAHFGRRCFGQQIINGESERCEYRWSSKDCPDCEHPNDIAARFCELCDCELVDPNEKLRLDFQRIKADPYSLSTDRVLSWQCRKHVSAAGNDTLRVTYTTEYRSFDVWYMPKRLRLWSSLCGEVFGKEAPDVDTFLQYVNTHGRMPRTVTVKRDKGSKFFTIYSHGAPADEMPN